MNDLISRQATIDVINKYILSFDAIDVNFLDGLKTAIKLIKEDVPSALPERTKGKWTEKQVIHADEAKEVVEEWQSCRCSICGRYNTQPYMYYFSEPNYCSFCGADMREETNE